MELLVKINNFQLFNYFGKKLHLRRLTGFRMCLCSNLCADVAFIVTRISERLDIQGKWFNASIKLIKRLFLILVFALMGHILNKNFKMKYEAHAYEIEFEIENILKSEIEKIEINLEN